MERAVAGPAVDDRRRAVVAAVNGIADPCSLAMTEAIGIADLGLVEDVRIDEGHVEVVLVPTSPQCLFVGLFEEEVEARVSALDFVESVSVRFDEGGIIWDENRMTSLARERLERRRAALKAAAAPGRGPHAA